jgi:formamidopyrimidine-DNA glycosylase
MPELPELEVLKELLDHSIGGRTVTGARAIRPGLLRTVDPPLDALIGRILAAIDRRGKHLIFAFGSDLCMVVHLMLAGRLLVCDAATRNTKATGLTLTLDDGRDLRLVEGGHTKRAALYIVRAPEDVERLARTGVEPLSPDFTVDRLAELAANRRRQAKKLLTDPSQIAGIGTAYADEILFAAEISPVRYVNRLSREEIARLHGAVQEVLRDAIERIRADAEGGAFVGEQRRFVKVYKRAGEPCPRCSTPIEEIRYAQTRTFYCPSCQAGGRQLPDRRSWLTR